MNALGKLSDAWAMADLDAGAEYLKKQPVVFTNSISCLGFRMGEVSLPMPRTEGLEGGSRFTVAPSTRSPRSSPNPLWIWRRESRPASRKLRGGRRGHSRRRCQKTRRRAKEKQQNIRYQDIPEVADYSVTVKDYRDFLCILFDVWYNDGQPVASIRLFENFLAIGMGVEPEICAFKNRCGSYVVVEYNGDVYPCDFFVEEQWLLGNLLETPIQDLMKKRKRREFSHRKMEQSSGCKACEWNVICHYGCQHYRSVLGENVLREAYREFFRYTGRCFEVLKENYLRGHS